MKSYFRSSGYLSDIDLEKLGDIGLTIKALPPFLRTLLVADGTVTKALEAFFWEPVEVVSLNQQCITRSTPINELDLPSGRKILHREVRLTGEQSKTTYACARSLLVLELLPPQMQQAIVEGRIGIGEILREQGVETYREIVTLGFIPKAEVTKTLQPIGCSDVISRSYRIKVGGAPAILVTEFFPIRIYS